MSVQGSTAYICKEHLQIKKKTCQEKNGQIKKNNLKEKNHLPCHRGKEHRPTFGADEGQAPKAQSSRERPTAGGDGQGFEDSPEDQGISGLGD